MKWRVGFCILFLRPEILVLLFYNFVKPVLRKIEKGKIIEFMFERS